MSRTQCKLIGKAISTSLIAFALVPAANAQTIAPAAGLEQHWPNVADMSSSPNWNLYLFHLQGIKFVQVNDLNTAFTVQSCPQTSCSGPGITSQIP